MLNSLIAGISLVRLKQKAVEVVSVVTNIDKPQSSIVESILSAVVNVAFVLLYDPVTINASKHISIGNHLEYS